MADRRRRRRRASQDDSEEEEEESGSESTESAVQPGQQKVETREPVLRRADHIVKGNESECESEDGIEGEAVLSDYESAEESEEEEARRLSDEEPLKEELKQENDATDTPAPKEEKTRPKGTVTGERQSGDGQESTEPDENKAAIKSQKHLDDDEDRKNPAYIPRKGLFFEHDLRGHTQDEEVRPKGRHPRKLWKDEGRWEHDRFREDEQAPKSREELIALYGYDIRSCKNPEDIRPRRPRKPRFSSPTRREENDEKPYRFQTRNSDFGSAQQARPYNNRNDAGSGRTTASRAYTKSGGNKENRATYQNEEDTSQQPVTERRKEYGSYRARSTEQTPPPIRNGSPEAAPATRVEPIIEKQVEETSPPPPDRPVEKKSYSRARRSRIKGVEGGKNEEAALSELPPPPLVSPTLTQEISAPSPAPMKPISWEATVDGSIAALEQVNLSDQNWSPNQPQYIAPQGMPNHIHMPGGPPPQYNRLEGMPVQGGRVKRYSSQRQRHVPEPAPMHIGIMEGHYYDPLQFQGPIYAHGDGPSSMPPQGMIVPPEMHLPHPALHPHQSPAPMSTPNIYPAPVSLPPSQPPPQQLLPPPYFTAPPSVMNFGNPTYPYAPSALPPPPPAHLYPNPQTQSQVYGGVTYYNPVQQQVQLKPSPPRRTSQPVTIKPPPPEETRQTVAKERNSS
ncbi:protein CASC3 [Bombina bombina]|uniref:protein CASC3 n=1 Tax=Bombina bombina TaxID=8345 RepID=UPI00235ADFB1|nr:protein CASC3 [Bombina bombina]